MQSQRSKDQSKAILFRNNVQLIRSMEARKDGLNQEKVLIHVASMMKIPRSYIATLTAEQRAWIWS